MTGAPIAAGADAIVPVERTRGTGEWSNFWSPRRKALSSGRVARTCASANSRWLPARRSRRPTLGCSRR